MRSEKLSDRRVGIVPVAAAVAATAVTVLLGGCSSARKGNSPQPNQHHKAPVSSYENTVQPTASRIAAEIIGHVQRDAKHPENTKPARRDLPIAIVYRNFVDHSAVPYLVEHGVEESRLYVYDTVQGNTMYAAEAIVPIKHGRPDPSAVQSIALYTSNGCEKYDDCNYTTKQIVITAPDGGPVSQGLLDSPLPWAVQEASLPPNVNKPGTDNVFDAHSSAAELHSAASAAQSFADAILSIRTAS